MACEEWYPNEYEMKQRSVVNDERDGLLVFKKKRVLKIRDIGRRDDERDVDQTGDCSTKQEQNNEKICLQFKTRGERRATKGDKVK